MEFFYNISIYLDSIDYICYNFIKGLYMFIYTIVNSVLGYCPLFYQLMYFYLPIIIYVRIKKNSNNDKKAGTFFDSTYNYFFFLSKFVTIYLYNVCRNFLEIYLYFFKKTSIYIFLLNKFLKKSLNFFWRPIFKKISYFGLYSSVRSKWYKNKK